MLKYTTAFSGFSVDDISKAKAFYKDTLGLEVTEDGDSLRLHIDDGKGVYVYPKPNHEPATYTILNFQVSDVKQAVQDLKASGVTIENYPGTGSDEDGISQYEGGPRIAWFKDPAGNILSVIEV